MLVRTQAGLLSAPRRAGRLHWTYVHSPAHARRPGSTARVYEDAESVVSELLARDRKNLPDLVATPEFVDTAADNSNGDTKTNVEDVMLDYERRSSVASPSTSSDRSSSKADRRVERGSGVLKSKGQRQREMARAADGSTTKAGEADLQRPKRCKEAIDAGLALFQQRDFLGAIDLFNLALELPGNGAYRVSGSPREYSCPSEAEENAVLYNMACAYAQMRQADSALTCLEAVLESGFTEYDTIRTDPDLAPVRGPQLDALLGRFDNVATKLKKMMGGGAKGGSEAKPWILW